MEPTGRISAAAVRHLCKRLLGVRVWKVLSSIASTVRQLRPAARAIAVAYTSVRRSESPRKVVFVSDLPRSREAKLARGLQQSGWRVVLLHREAPEFDPGLYCPESRAYRNRWDGLRACYDYKPAAYHVFSNWDFEVAATIVRYRPGGVVFDDCDVIPGMIKASALGESSCRQLALERYCLENTDGLCCRSLETQFAKKRLGYRLRGKRLLLLDCCWDDGCRTERPPRSGELHLVYVGNLPFLRADNPILDRNCSRIAQSGAITA